MDNNFNKIKLNILFDIESTLENQYDIETGKQVDFEGEWADLYYSGFQYNYETFGKGYNGIITDEYFASKEISKVDKELAVELVIRLSIPFNRKIDHNEIQKSNKYLLDILYLNLSEFVIFKLKSRVKQGREINKSNISLVRKEIEVMRDELVRNKILA